MFEAVAKQIPHGKGTIDTKEWVQQDKNAYETFAIHSLATL